MPTAYIVAARDRERLTRCKSYAQGSGDGHSRANQTTLSVLIRRMSARTPASMRGRPPKFRDFQRQYRRKPVRAFRNSPQSSHV